MGFGTDPAGAGPAGLDLPASTAQRQAATPVALAFDGLAQDFQLDANGRYKTAHPVDAKVFQILRTAIGSIRSAVNVGQGIKGIAYIDQQTIVAQVRDLVRVALREPLAAGEITVRAIDLDTSIRGRIAARVDYVNLITGKRESATS